MFRCVPRDVLVEILLLVAKQSYRDCINFSGTCRYVYETFKQRDVSKGFFRLCNERSNKRYAHTVLRHLHNSNPPEDYCNECNHEVKSLSKQKKHKRRKQCKFCGITFGCRLSCMRHYALCSGCPTRCGVNTRYDHCKFTGPRMIVEEHSCNRIHVMEAKNGYQLSVYDKHTRTYMEHFNIAVVLFVESRCNNESVKNKFQKLIASGNNHFVVVTDNKNARLFYGNGSHVMENAKKYGRENSFKLTRYQTHCLSVLYPVNRGSWAHCIKNFPVDEVMF